MPTPPMPKLRSVEAREDIQKMAARILAGMLSNPYIIQNSPKTKRELVNEAIELAKQIYDNTYSSG